jgi:GAF domain-containing protein
LLVVIIGAALPPVVAFALLFHLAPDWIDATGHGTVLLLAAGLTVAWAGMVAVVGNRLVVDEASRMVDLARRGTSADTSASRDELTGPQRRLAAALDERNRQIAELAAQVRAAPIATDAAAVAHSMVRAARAMTDDPTWTLAVLRAASTDALPPGLYDAEGSVAPLEEVHRWAAALDEGVEVRPARHAIGPWGAFVVVGVRAGDELRAVLLAPWEGRGEPSGAELDLFALLGQHAATAIEHALLYARTGPDGRAESARGTPDRLPAGRDA